jgi:hypothetical protein
MKKQTAVDYLHTRYMYVTWLRNRDEISAKQADDFRVMYLKLAKRMEKEQIKEAYESGVWDLGCRNSDSKKYYNETYENK